MDLVHRRALEPHRRRLLSALDDWLQSALGVAPHDRALYERALTHGSQSSANYERLEFLGDRVLGLVVARWLLDRYPDEPEGALSRRLNTIVTGVACAAIGRRMGVPAQLRLGKQARDDGASDSDNVLGDVVEALIGALYLDHGFEAADALIRREWHDLVDGHAIAPRHPKSALQEWAASHGRRPPEYTVTARNGPHHAPRFTVTVNIAGAGEASAEGTSKQEAETAAAERLLDELLP